MTTPTDGQQNYAAGWYPDANASGTERWYDGTAWTEQTRPLGGPAAASAPAAAANVPTVAEDPGAKRPWFKRKGIIIPVGIVAGLIIIGSVGSALGGGNRDASPTADDKETPISEVRETAESEPESEPEMVAVPAGLVGMTAKDAAAALEAAGLRATFNGDAAWKVLSTDASGAEVEAGTTVTLTLDEPPALTLGQENAVEEAKSYISFTSFSRAGLIEQLTSEYGSGFEAADAEFAVNYLEQNMLVDWNAEAVEAAEDYLDMTSFSRSSLYDQLTSEYGSQFTPEQADYALKAVGY
ncbi:MULTISPECIES: Ltp family lipoprotein [Microbacterium]|uniref:PASTA domain-containing protein n=1 Tax=Microbacterium saccharophilum TaxID=1213358 RepID=A0A7Z7GDK2_9MICO|nr:MULTISPECIES: Ltp family lipoprotein [Microbacterium]SFI48908.1 PASTA domain-containing protein [Microbacterium saccharophilum]